MPSWALAIHTGAAVFCFVLFCFMAEVDFLHLHCQGRAGRPSLFSAMAQAPGMVWGTVGWAAASRPRLIVTNFLLNNYTHSLGPGTESGKDFTASLGGVICLVGSQEIAGRNLETQLCLNCCGVTVSPPRPQITAQ